MTAEQLTGVAAAILGFIVAINDANRLAVQRGLHP